MTRSDTTFVSGEPCIAYDQAGEGDIVLFLHWIGGIRSNWRDQSRAFVRNYHAAAWDARDYGGSTMWAARPVILLVLCGCSIIWARRRLMWRVCPWGADALDLAARFPDRIKTLTLSARAPVSSKNEAEWDEIVRLREKLLV